MIHSATEEKVIIKCEDCEMYSTVGTLSASLRKFIIHMLEHRGLGQTFETRVRNIAREEVRKYPMHVASAIDHAIGMHVAEKHHDVDLLRSPEWFNKQMKDQAEYDRKTTATEAVLRSEDKRVQPCQRRFVLNRRVDSSGISGLGVVAEGVVFSTGQVVLCWLRSTHEGRGSVATYDSIEQCQQIHGHNGDTLFVFKD